jgi:thiol-disulfide isomerase/thioredoxin
VPFIDRSRLLIALPLLAALGIGLYLLLRGDDADASTPRAVLTDTPAAAGAERVGVQKDRIARDFAGYGPGGSELRLSDLRGHPAVINFWATWCTSCLTEMPELKEVQEEFGADNISVVAVNSGESAGQAQEFVDFLDAPAFHYVYDPSLVITDAYGVIGLSTSVFVDAQGVIRATYTGQMSKDLMRQFITSAMDSSTAAEPPPRFRLPGSVEARTSVLEVEDVDAGLRFTSRRLRCDDSFCAQPVADALAKVEGVGAVDADLVSDPPVMMVGYDDAVLSRDELTDTVVRLIEQLQDPLYQQPVEVKP